MSEQSPELRQAVERVGAERRRYACTMHGCDALAHAMPTLAFDAALAAALRLAKVEGMVAGHANGCSGPDCPYVYEHGLMLAAARAACEAL